MIYFERILTLIVGFLTAINLVIAVILLAGILFFGALFIANALREVAQAILTCKP